MLLSHTSKSLQFLTKSNPQITMYLIFDTETTGFPNEKVSPDDPSQARIVQLAFVLLDEHLNEKAAYSTLVHPKGKWQVPTGAQAVHGISTKDCEKYGAPNEVVMSAFDAAWNSSKKRVAHNIAFDKKLVNIERWLINAREPYSWSEGTICTMELMTPICKLPNKNGRAGYKWPKLSEAYKHVTGQELQGAHDALADVRGCVTVLKWLVANRHVQL